MVATPYGECEYDAAGRTMWSGGELLGPAHQTAGGVWMISDVDQVEMLLEVLVGQEVTGVDTEYDGIDEDDGSVIGKAHIVCAQFSWPDEALGKHPVHSHVTLAQRTFFPNFGIAEEDRWLHRLKNWLASPDHGKCGSFLFSSDLHVFKNHGLIVNGIRGCGVRQSQTWRMGKVFEHGLKPLGTDTFGYEMRDFNQVFSTPKLKKDGQPYANDQRTRIPLQVAFSDPASELYAKGVDYSSLDSKVSLEGDTFMRGELDKMTWRDGQSMLAEYDTEWNPYQYIIAGMEDAGWPIDSAWFTFQRERAQHDKADLTERLNQWAGGPIGWGSWAQKQHLIYGKAGEKKVIADVEVTGKGFPISPVCKQGPTANEWKGTQKLSTDGVAMQWVRDHVRRKEDKAGLETMIKWTKVDKLLSAFLVPLPKWVDRYGVVHSKIGPEAGTNRLTVRQPPLQTMPVAERDPYSVREGLSAQPEVWNHDVAEHFYRWMTQYGFEALGGQRVDPRRWYDQNLVLIGLDYSQLEMRILAHYLVVLFGDHALANDLADGDLHANTALRVWGNDPLLKGLTSRDIKDHKNPLVKLFRNRGKIINFCVSEDTTALTPEGWKRWDQFRPGDLVLGRDGWTTVRAVHSYNDTELVDMWGFHVTRNHRWWAERRTTVNMRRTHVKEFVETEAFTNDHRARLSVSQDFPDTSGLTPDEAAIVAWIVTDGSIDKKGYASIFQKDEGKFAHVIDALLLDIPHSRYVRPTGIVQWRLRASDWHRRIVGVCRGVDERWVLTLGTEQRRRFVEAGLQAEGWERKRPRADGQRQRFFGQNAGPVADAFRLAFFLEGAYVPQTEYTSYTGKRFLQMGLSSPYKTRQRKPLESVGVGFSWCLTTDDGTFTIRRGDRIALTGNSVNYGKTEVGLGADIRDEDGEPIGPVAARAILHQYFSAYPGILKYHKWAKSYVKANGYVRTIGGRYRFLPDIRSPVGARRGEAERAALNTPIQGSAADVVCKAMLRSNTLPIPDMIKLGYFDEELYDLGARLVMQIHDELVWRVPYCNAQRAMERITYHMERPFHPTKPGFVASGLPLPVDGSIAVTYLGTK